jgi:O-acetyl-ADP-ribose deacetylase (regulator of RNase III)/DNA-binding transcriptional MerR regulator
MEVANMSKKSAASFFLIDELVARVNAQLPADQQVTERTVRYYMSNNLIGKGLKISELPKEFSSTISQRGNQRYFTTDDRDVVVATRTALSNGLTIEQLGGRPSSLKTEPLMKPVMYSRSFEVSDNLSNYVTSSPASMPEIRDAWSLQLRGDLTLTGTGTRPSIDTVRDLQNFINQNFAPEKSSNSDDEYFDFDDTPSTRSLRIEIELVDIAAPFEGLLVNASNAEVTPGGGASGRIWEVCGVEELMPERPINRLPLKPGQVALTSAGRAESLGFTGVIHAYGPRWTSPVDKEALHKGKKQIPMNGEEQTLIRTWENILKMADEHSESRLAAPLISSGLFGYPFQDCAEVTFETLLETPTLVTHVHIRTVSRRSFDQLVEARNRVLRKLDIA